MKSTNQAIFFLFLILGLNSCTVAKVNKTMKSYPIAYELSMPQPNSHYFEVKMEVNLEDNFKAGFLDFKMAAWTPGSYLIREYAKNVEGFEAFVGTSKLKSAKNSKNTWRVNIGSERKITVKYKVYAFEMTVRTSHLDDSHGYANGAAVFMYLPQFMSEKSVLKVVPHESFKTVSVELPEIAKNTFEVENFDILVDSPIEIGNHEVLEFEASGVKHRVANYSLVKLNYNKDKLLSDYKKVTEAAASVIGGTHPCKSYLFIVHHLPGIGGGLEHLNSTTCQTSPDAYESQDKYIGFFGLIAHEYFHLWNVKRIRPVALGPFDYENENYTNMLWVSEGFTSYFQDDILRRAGMIEDTKMLSAIAAKIGSIENSYGNKVQSVAEASWDAWIKYYRPNENSNNSTVSYYTKGGVLANIINMEIIGKTNGRKSIEDVFRLLYKDFYLTKDIGYTDDEFKKACETIAGADMTPLFENCIYGTQMIDYKEYFKNVGVDFIFDLAYPNTPWSGINVRNKMVTRVDRGSGAYDYGINVNDEILKIDGINFTDVSDFTRNKSVGEKIKVELRRSGKIMEYTVPLVQNPAKSVNLKPIDKSNPLYKKWMHL